MAVRAESLSVEDLVLMFDNVFPCRVIEVPTITKDGKQNKKRYYVEDVTMRDAIRDAHHCGETGRFIK